MKTNTLMRVLAVFGLLAGMLATSAHAQTIRMQFDIPFQFLAGDKVLPAGEYRVEVDPASRRMNLRLADGTDGLFLSTRPDQRAGAVAEKGTLQFNKYGNRHFLRQVWSRGGSMGYGLPITGAEREMAKMVPTTPGTEIASTRVYQK